MKPRPVDPDFVLPKGRRNLFEHGEDLARVNFWLLIFCCLTTVTVTVMGGVIAVIFLRPPYILSEDDGYVAYRTTQVFRLDEIRIKTFLDLVCSKLFNQNPGVYDLNEMAPFLDPQIITTFTTKAKDTAADRIKFNERRYFSMYDARRYPDPANPDIIVAAVRGDIAYFRDGKADVGDGTNTITTTRTSSYPVTCLVYLKQIRPDPVNGWGLVVQGIRVYQASEVDEASAAWDKSVPFYRTLLPDGTVVSKRQRDDLLRGENPPIVNSPSLPGAEGSAPSP